MIGMKLILLPGLNIGPSEALCLILWPMILNGDDKVWCLSLKGHIFLKCINPLGH